MRELPPSHQLQQERANEIAEYLARFRFHWHATLTNPDDSDNYFYCLRKYEYWQNWIQRDEEINIGSYLVSAYSKKWQHKHHFHALMYGQNRQNKLLTNCSRSIWAYRWQGHAKIVEVYNTRGISEYLGNHFQGFMADRAELIPYGPEILKRIMRSQQDGLDNYDGLG
jgi:hypothetical protein